MLKEEVVAERGLLRRHCAHVKAPANENVAPENFDWNLESGIEGYSKADIEKYDKMYDGTLTSISEKEVVSTVVAITKEVVINIGYNQRE